MKLIPARITSLREYKGLSQAEFADLVGIEQSYVSKLERGIAPNVSGVILAHIASVLETSTDYLLNLTNDPAPRPPVDPPLDDPDFRRLMECCEIGGPQLIHTLVDIAELTLHLPPTRPFEPNLPPED